MCAPTIVGTRRVAPEDDRAAHGLRLEAHVVVEQLDEVALGPRERLGHRARESAGAAEVRLRDDLQRLAERCARPRGTRAARRRGGRPGR